MMSNKIKISSNRDFLQINIPIELIVFSQSRREDHLNITNVKKMKEDFCKNFLDFGKHDYGNQYGKFFDLLDDWFLSRLENGELYLEGENEDL